MKYIMTYLLLLLSGCANSGAWSEKPTRMPLPVRYTIYVDFPCGHKDWNGCWNENALTVEVRKGLSKADTACVLRHELNHAKGYTHGDQRHYYRIDCGA